MNTCTSVFWESGDYWKLTKDGGLQYDGQGYLRDEAGLYINTDGSRSSSPNKPGKTTVGADGVETGLLNILNGGTSGLGYDKFSSEQKANAQWLMGISGLSSQGVGANAQWGSVGSKGVQGALANANMDMVLDNNLMLSLYGSTLADASFVKQYGSDILNLAQGTMSLSRLNGLSVTSTLDHIAADATKLKATEQTVTDANGNKSTFFMPSPDSPILSQLYNQHDFKGLIPALDDHGCNFMDVVSTCEMITGKALSMDQIKSVWNSTAGTGVGSIVNSDYAIVNSPNNLAEKLLAELGRSDLGLSYPGQKDASGATAVAVRDRRYYDAADYHFTLSTVSGKPLYNPGYTSKDLLGGQNIYVYKK